MTDIDTGVTGVRGIRVEEFVGRRMREIRERNGMTQEALGIYLGALLRRPWSRQVVSLAENGQRAFVAADLLALAQVLDVSPIQLLTPPPDVREVEMPSGKSIPSERLIEPNQSEAATSSTRRIRSSLADLADSKTELLKTRKDIAQIMRTVTENVDRLTTDICNVLDLQRPAHGPLEQHD